MELVTNSLPDVCIQYHYTLHCH